MSGWMARALTCIDAQRRFATLLGEGRLPQEPWLNWEERPAKESKDEDLQRSGEVMFVAIMAVFPGLVCLRALGNPAGVLVEGKGRLWAGLHSMTSRGSSQISSPPWNGAKGAQLGKGTRQRARAPGTIVGLLTRCPLI